MVTIILVFHIIFCILHNIKYCKFTFTFTFKFKGTYDIIPFSVCFCIGQKVEQVRWEEVTIEFSQTVHWRSEIQRYKTREPMHALRATSLDEMRKRFNQRSKVSLWSSSLFLNSSHILGCCCHLFCNYRQKLWVKGKSIHFYLIVFHSVNQICKSKTK